MESFNSEKIAIQELEDKVLHAMKIYNRPVTIEEISNELALPLYRTNVVFSRLRDRGEIISYASAKGKRVYYTPATDKRGLDDVLAQKYADMAGSLEKQFAEIKAENESLHKQIDQIYANILTIMGIFVALFALIVINVEAIGIFISNISDASVLFWSLLKINIPILIAITVLVLLIKFLLHTSKRK